LVALPVPFPGPRHIYQNVFVSWKQGEYTQVYFNGWIEEESLLILPDEESKLLLGELRPFSLAEEPSPVIEGGLCNCNNFGAAAVGDDIT
jgi:hypothetical protein